VINLKPPVLFGTMPMGEHLKLDMGLVKNGSAMRPQYAFRLVPINPDDFDLLGFKLGPYLFY
jgi:hypothetical protein